MKLKERIYATRHMMMPGHTLGAAIKQKNLYDVDQEEMKLLMAQFIELNGNAVMNAGSSCLIPILPRHRTSSPANNP